MSLGIENLIASALSQLKKSTYRLVLLVHLRHELLVQHPRVADLFVHLGVIKHDVERQHERSGVLAGAPAW